MVLISTTVKDSRVCSTNRCSVPVCYGGGLARIRAHVMDDVLEELIPSAGETPKCRQTCLVSFLSIVSQNCLLRSVLGAVHARKNVEK